MSEERLLPSRFRLPQRCSPDRRRAREATLRRQRALYGLVTDPPVLHEGREYTLPPRIDKMPAEEAFTPVKRAWMLGHKFVAAVNAMTAMALNPLGRTGGPRDFARLLVTIPAPPLVLERWRDDDEFARQRLNGANPQELQLWTAEHFRRDGDRRLLEAADVVLRHNRSRDLFLELLEGGRVFAADYSLMEHPLVQQHVAQGHQLASPLGLFYADASGTLRSLLIRLSRKGEVYTPLAPDARWLYARAHLQAADGLVHEGVRHLLETHLVTEVVRVVTARQLHPDHPVQQLLEPHLRFTIALDCLARVDLLSPGGPIDVGVAAGVGGALNLARMHWAEWDFAAADPREDFARRGLSEGPLEGYYYRDDALRIFALLEQYVGELLAVWYTSDEEVTQDTELREWARELAGPGALRGFPASFQTVAELQKALARILYRCTAGHAAVNNGQWEKYTWVPNSPGSLRAVALGPDGAFTEDQLWQLFPERRRALAQLSMAWILSTPTDRSLVAAGEVPAFDPALSPAAARAVGSFRRALKDLSSRIGLRNAELVRQQKVPYTWLDPYNISCSVDT